MSQLPPGPELRRRPYVEPAFVSETVFETLALSCGKGNNGVASMVGATGYPAKSRYAASPRSYRTPTHCRSTNKKS